jgi:hypothetical protein
MFKLINKPNFMTKIKNIFLHGENEKSYNINDGDIIIELHPDETIRNENNKSNFVVEKYNNTLKKKIIIYISKIKKLIIIIFIMKDVFSHIIIIITPIV